MTKRPGGRGAAPFLEAGLVVLVAASIVMLALYALRSSPEQQPLALLVPRVAPSAAPRVVSLPAGPRASGLGDRGSGEGGTDRVAGAIALPPGILAELAAARKTVIVTLDMTATPERGIETRSSGSDAAETTATTDDRNKPPSDPGTEPAGSDPDPSDPSPSPTPDPNQSESGDENSSDDEGSSP